MTDFEGFVREYQDMVYATAVRLLGCPGDAEDMAQAVFLKAYERFGEIGSSPAAAGWLKTVTVRMCLNHLARYRGRWRLFSELGEDYDTAAPEAPSPDERLDRADRLHALERALRQLPDAQRVPLVLFHFEEMSYQGIADALEISVGKVKTDIHRGREALRKELVADARFG
jgi:RNA polymerase sigma-70 factor (ECF subfamily)